MKQVSSTKSLGVHIDQDMNWESHIQNKIAFALGAIKRIPHLIENNDSRLILRKKLIGGNDMIESKLKAKNCNRGQLFQPCWVSSARCSK